ncbi:phenoloxidase-activating factor 2-like [Pollicipes pollicipes]|uniref:phenoloxidase-activating factor 2-like n=1 Tax=Pollicipes pollicipes TaxID=41117 RepID=UPI0018856CB0|nr:phenoloxidase-activating factor 2-like [Pollicipes pollicipes]
MRACQVVVVALLASVAAVHAESIDPSKLPASLAKPYAIFLASGAATSSTTFTLEHTRITITKNNAAKSSSLAARPRGVRFVVTDAAAKGLVCVPKGSLKASGSGGAGGAEIIAGAGEAQKADITIGQGKGITATINSGISTSASASGGGAASAASSVGGAASAAASGGGAASAASSGGGAASAASGDRAASSAASGEGGASAASSSGDSSSASTSGHAEAAAAGGDSSVHASSAEGGLDVSVSGEGAQASASDGDRTITAGGSDRIVIDERFCECVPAYLCDEEGYINTFGSGIIDIRSFTNKRVRNYLSKCKPDETCCRHRDNEPIGWLPSGCGTRSPVRLDRRIVGGEASAIGRYPWMVAILKATTGDPEYLCGGSLIAEDVVLTGAHCVEAHQGQQLIARVGEWDTSKPDTLYPHQDIPVSKVITHEAFNDKTLFNDVALLKLSHPAEISQHVNTICLPVGAAIDLKDCVANGWGKESFANSQYTNILKEVPLSVVDSGTCQKELRTTKLGRWFKLHDSFLCAGGEKGIDTCKGDGGSPLVCRVADATEEETFVQVGIVAWGIGCGQENIPGVYADVDKLLPWIQANLPKLSEDLTVGYP